MLSYRHAFHAGNHADVLKHFIEVRLLRYLAQKDKPFWYIDTHAGAGCYSLDTGYATQNAEYESGIARLWHRNDLPAPLHDFVALVKKMNPDDELKLYPGSPLVALELLRDQDKLRLYELHPSDSEILRDNFAAYGNKVLIQTADGFGALKALLPPPPRHALVILLFFIGRVDQHQRATWRGWQQCLECTEAICGLDECFVIIGSKIVPQDFAVAGVQFI